MLNLKQKYVILFACLVTLLCVATFIGLAGLELNNYDTMLKLIKHQLNITSSSLDHQWYLYNRDMPGHDINVIPVWKKGLTGKGVTICINDLHGLNHSRVEFNSRYLPKASYDFSDFDSNPMPQSTSEEHANMCGAVAAGSKDSGGCAVGVAYDASISSILKSSVDNHDKTLSYGFNVNDIYSCSWGEIDDGRSISSLPNAIEHSLAVGISQGRKRLGSIYVFASGNGATNGDNCSFDPYSNSIYTIAVGGIYETDRIAEYSEGCTGLMLVSYSGQKRTREIRSAKGGEDGHCTNTFVGTSAATPMVSGAIALLLQLRPELTWRDVQNILIRTAKPIDRGNLSWEPTHIGLSFSNQYGYGKLDVQRTINYATSYDLLNNHSTHENYTVASGFIRRKLLKAPSVLVLPHEITVNNFYIEQVTVTISLRHRNRRQISVALISPNKIRSQLIEPRSRDNSNEGFRYFTVKSLKHWGEPLLGIWHLVVKDNGNGDKSSNYTGLLDKYSMNFYGHSAK